MSLKDVCPAPPAWYSFVRAGWRKGVTGAVAPVRVLHLRSLFCYTSLWVSVGLAVYVVWCGRWKVGVPRVALLCLIVCTLYMCGLLTRPSLGLLRSSRAHDTLWPTRLWVGAGVYARPLSVPSQVKAV